MDLIRAILMQMEDHEWGYAPKIQVPGHTDDVIGFHVWLLADADLVEAVMTTTTGDSSPQAVPLHLTWKGYEFLEAVRSDSAWQNGKKVLLSKVGGLSFELLKAVLLSEAKRHVGIG